MLGSSNAKEFPAVALSALVWAVIAFLCARIYLSRMPMDDWRVIYAAICSPIVGLMVVCPHRLNTFGEPVFSFVAWTMLQLSCGVTLLGFAIGIGALIEHSGVSWVFFLNLPRAMVTSLWLFVVAFWNILGVLLILALFNRGWLMVRLGYLERKDLLY
ncbi:MAG: hypothetical protein AAFW98_12340 [Pseudomonadota bacterium]